MSLASVHHAKLHVSLSANSLNLLDELIPSRWLTNDPKPALPRDDVPIEFKTCFTCGVNWYDDHVSLDCSECGGYSLERPCADCEGKCGAVWERDLQKSHAYKRPFWMGKCQAPGSSQDKMDAEQKKPDASEGLSMRLDKLSVKNS